MNPIFKKRVTQLFGWSDEKFDEIYSKMPYRGIRINPLKSNLQTVQKSFDFELKQSPFFGDSYYIPSDFEGIGNNPLHHAGAYYVQEPSASSVLSAVGELESGFKVLDLCAAPGGKSTGIAAALPNTALLWSNEYIRPRAAALLSNIERMGISNAVVSSLSADYLCNELSDFFNVVVVDAPCSGEGMWRHNEQVEKQWSEKYVEECAALQKKILSAAVEALSPGGRLIYSTCTFSKEENEDNVKWLLKNYPEFKLLKIDDGFGSRGISGDDDIDDKVRRVLPTDGGEGHFIALFEKQGEPDCISWIFIKENISPENKKIVTAFLEDNFISYPEGVLWEKNGSVYIAPYAAVEIKGDILRFGLLLGEIRKNRLEPAHALFTAANVKPKRCLDLDLDDERLYKFLKGEEIPFDGESGYTAISVLGAPLGFGKCSSGRITNRYPKGLRLL